MKRKWKIYAIDEISYGRYAMNIREKTNKFGSEGNFEINKDVRLVC